MSGGSPCPPGRGAVDSAPPAGRPELPATPPGGTRGTRARLGVLAALYVTQFLGVGFITIGLTGILRQGGTALDTLALVQLIGLIWPLKVLWAPLVDRYGSRRHGHHRSWLLVTQTGMVLALFTLLPFDPPARQLGGVVAVCAVYVLFSATQDIAADALAVRLLAPEERGPGNGVQVAGSYVGTVVGGGLCVVVYDRWGWGSAVTLLAVMTSAGLAVVWRLGEPQAPAGPRDDPPRGPDGPRDDPRRAPAVDRPSLGQAFRAMVSVFAQPGCARWALGVLPPVYAGAAGVNALVTPALVDAGWSLGRVGVVTGVVTSLPAILVGLGAGALVARVGRAVTLVLGSAALVGSTAAMVPLLGGHAPTAVTTAVLCGFMAGYTAVNVVFYTVAMDLARPATAGTDFTVLSSVALAVSFVAAGIALGVAGWVGYVPVACGAAALVALGSLAGVRQLGGARLLGGRRLLGGGRRGVPSGVFSSRSSRRLG